MSAWTETFHKQVVQADGELSPYSTIDSLYDRKISAELTLIEIDYLREQIFMTYPIYKNHNLKRELKYDHFWLSRYDGEIKVGFTTRPDSIRINYNLSQHSIEIIDSDKKGHSQYHTLLCGADLKIHELNSEYKPFYDKALDTNAYLMDLNLLAGKWYSTNLKDTLFLQTDLISEKKIFNSYCSDSLLSSAVTGYFYFKNKKSGQRGRDFTVCIAQKDEVYFIEVDGCLVDHSYIRELTEDELVIDHENFAVRDKRLLTH